MLFRSSPPIQKPHSHSKPTLHQLPASFSPANLEKKKVVELKEIASKLGCTNYRNLKKAELIKYVKNCKLKKINSSPISSNLQGKLLHGLVNIGNSCYLDSVLLSLLSVPNDFVDRYIFGELTKRKITNLVCNPNGMAKSPTADLNNRILVQKELANIRDSIRDKGDIEYCTGLRQLIRYCPHPEKFHNSKPKDAGEFLTYLLSLFNTNVATKSNDVYFTEDAKVSNYKDMEKLDTEYNRKSSIVHDIFQDDLLSIPSNLKTKTLLTTVMDSGELDPENYYQGVYKRVVRVSTIVEAPYLIIYAHRIRPDSASVISKRIVPSRSIQAGANYLKLSAIVIHQGSSYGGHYTAYLKVKKNWYYYNDLGPSIKLIGGYKELLEASPSPLSKGILYFYS